VAAGTTITNDATEKTIYSKSIAGGTLGTLNRIQLRLMAKMNANSADGTARTATLRIKYGATTLMTWTLTITDAAVRSGAADAPSTLEVWLNGNGATNAQIAHARMFWPQQTSAGGYWITWTEGWNTSAEDSTAAKTFAVTLQYGQTKSDDSYTRQHSSLEKVA
jgi:hypothetical protein